MTVNRMSKNSLATPTKYRNFRAGNVEVTGGILSEDATYFYRTFTSSGTLGIAGGSLQADVLIISGGGAGGWGYGSSRGGAGGGAGGMRSFFGVNLNGNTIVTVGAGGPVIYGNGASPSGNSSSISTYSTTGGGGGARGAGQDGGSGGSGGGNGGYSALAGNGIIGEGNAGYLSAGTSSRVGSGGGGKGAAATGQAGGAGVTDAMSNTTTVFATGGTGGSASSAEVGSAGTPNTGNGGNGGGGNASVGVDGGTGGAGGSGLVVVRYAKSSITSTFADYELIGTVNVAGSTSTVTFTGIPQNYKHLQVRGAARSDVASGYVDTRIKFNGDATAGNYSTHEVYGAGASAAAGGAGSYYPAGIAYSAGSSSATGIFGAIMIDIPDYANTFKAKVARCISGVVGSSNLIDIRSVGWYQTPAIATIELNTSGNFVAGSTFSLFGIRG